jgi:hypothetical protein
VPRKVFVSGEILTASDVNVNLMDQAVQRFASSAARGSAIPSPTEGMTSYLDDLNRIEVYNGSSWGAVGKILQVVSTLKTDTFSTSSTSFTGVTGLSATITPSSTSSKIMVIASVVASPGSTGDNAFHLRLSGGNSSAYVGAAAGSRVQAVTSMFHQVSVFGSYYGAPTYSLNYLDSPSSTSALTYAVEMRVNAGTSFVNRSAFDGDSSNWGRGASTITVMEVAG